MNALSWTRIGLLWSAGWLVFSVAHAVTAGSQALALVYGSCAGAHLVLGVMALRNLLRDLRRRKLMRRRRVLALRGIASAIVWYDRSDPSNTRHHAAWFAQLAAYRALDELVSDRAATGSPA